MYYALLITALAAVITGISAKSVDADISVRWYEGLGADTYRTVRQQNETSKRSTISAQATSEPGLLDFFKDEGYGSDERRTWLIQAPAGQSVLVMYIVADIEGSSSCSYDRLTLTDAQTGSQVWTCGAYNMHCMVLHTAGSTLQVDFSSDGSVGGKGFSLMYKAAPLSGTSTQNACDSPTAGGYFFKDDDVVSPSPPDGGSGNSDGDSDGGSDGGSSEGNAVTLVQTDGGMQCLGLYNDEGHLRSPNFPENYFNELNCSWNFEVAQNEIIVLTIDSLNIESQSSCSYDSLVLRGSSEDSYKLCSPLATPCSIVFRSSSLYVNFTSDGSYQERGYDLRLSAEPANSDVVSSCPVAGGPLPPDVIAHPYHGGHYGNNERLGWQEQVHENEYVMLTFDYFSLEHSDTCGYDYLSILDAHNPDQGKKLCGTALNSGCSITFPYNNVLLEFSSDGSVTDEGFRVEVTGVPSESYDPSESTCGIQVVALDDTPLLTTTPGISQDCGVITDAVGSLSMPDDGASGYQNDFYTCTTINADGQLLAVKIVKLHIEEGGSDCRYDAVSITYDGATHRYCGQVYNLDIYSTGDVIIEFSTDSSQTGPGWTIQWQRYSAGEALPFAVTTTDIDACSASRIVGGVEAAPHSHPWTIGLIVENSRICGGTIVSKDRVITAAHCVCGSENARMSIIAGDHTYATFDGTEQTVEVQEVIKHPSYDGCTLNNDIAVLKLKTDIVFNENIRPICVASSHPAPGTPCQASGWGTTTEGGSLARVLMEVDLPLISTDSCRAMSGLDITAQMFCAGRQQGGVDTCQGDSGGPLYCPINGVPQLVGVTSWGIGCGREDHPGIYANVAALGNWLSQHL